MLFSLKTRRNSLLFGIIVLALHASSPSENNFINDSIIFFPKVVPCNAADEKKRPSLNLTAKPSISVTSPAGRKTPAQNGRRTPGGRKQTPRAKQKFGNNNSKQSGASVEKVSDKSFFENYSLEFFHVLRIFREYYGINDGRLFDRRVTQKWDECGRFGGLSDFRNVIEDILDKSDAMGMTTLSNRGGKGKVYYDGLDVTGCF